MIKRVFIFTIIAVVLIVVGFFSFPLSFSTFPATEEFPRESTVALITNAQNNGERCREDIAYATEENKEYHKREGYNYTVDNICAELQKKLIAAISNENLDEVRTLISQGANVRGKDFSTFQPVYPLQIAAYRNYQTLKLILDNGADVNSKYCCCAMCDSPLVKAVRAGNRENVSLLLERGAEVSFKPYWADEPYTIFEVAEEKNSKEILPLLAKYCDKTFSCRVRYRYNLLANFIDKKF